MTCRLKIWKPVALVRLLLRVPIVLGLLIGASEIHGVKAQAPPGSFEPVSFRPGRGYFAQLPFEAVDMVSGNLSLTFTDVVLPGNGGMNLAVTRSLNYGGLNGPAWSIGLAGIPIAIQGTSAPADGPWTVGVLYTGGGAAPLAHQDGVDTYVLDNFLRITLSARTVELPNGWIATYETTPGATEAELQEVHDAFGNSIHAYWLSRAGGQTTATHINRLELSGGSDSTRTVYINYDASGIDALSVQSEGRTWTYTYAPDHTLLTATPPAGSPWQFAYATNALTVTTPNGGTVAYGFQGVLDSLGHTHPVVSSRTTGGRAVPAGTWQFSFDRSGDPIIGRVDLPDGRRLEWQHHAVTGASGVTYWTLARNSLSRYGVDVTHIDYAYTSCSDPSVPMVSQETTVQDGRTFTKTYAYHPSYEHTCDFHRPYQITETGELTRTTTFTFIYPGSGYRGDLVGSAVSAVGGQSFESDYLYNAQGFMTSVKRLGVETLAAPDAAGNLGSTTDPNGHVTSFTYQWGAVKNTQTPLYTVTREINTDGSVASVTRHGIQTTFSYDSVGRVISTSSSGRTPVTTAYNPDTTVVTQGSAVVTSQIDGFGRTTAVLSNAGLSQWLQYDALGQVILQSYPSDVSTWAADGFTYDDLGRVVSVSHSGGGAVQFAYAGTNVTVTDENGNATTQHWASFGPSDGRLLSVTDAAGQAWQYAYNGLGRLTSVTQPGGSVRTFTYNTRNQLASENNPESGTMLYTFDDAGNLTSRQDANGTSLSYVYDANNRLIGIQGAGADSVSGTYDAGDNPTTLANGAVTTTFTYDAADRLATRTDLIAGHSFASSYQYDGRDNLTSITYPSGRVVSYDYDVAGRITRVYDATTNYASGIAYHPSGGIASLTFGNGTIESNTFDGRYRPAQHVTGPLSLTYSYDAGGNVTQIADSRPSFTSSFGYDALNRLVSVTGWGANQFSYDPLGNRTWEANGNVTSSYDSHLRLTQASGSLGSSTFTYDAAGNLKTETGASYDYSPFNMLRSATVSGVQLSFAYDGSNERVIRSGSMGVTYSIYGPGGLPLAEYEDAGAAPALVREFIYLGARRIASIGRPAAAAAPSVSVALTAPSAGTVSNAGAPLTLKAQPYVSAGSIGWVEFYANGVYLGAATSAPYTLTVSSLPIGAWNLQARAVPVGGGIADSASVPISVVAFNAPPTVSLTAPTNNAVLGTGRSVTLSATAADSDGIAKVEFYRGSFLLATVTAPPYTFNWTNLQNGTYTLSAKAYDALGAATTSSPATVTVQPIATITVTPASPSAGTPASVTVDGAAFCSAVNVDFGDGSSQTFTGSGLPITNAHTWASSGPKTITAAGLGGACNNQITAMISVLAGPTVSFTAPGNGAQFTMPATINLAASATPGAAAISQVAFYVNGSLISTDASAPYTASWSPGSSGSYTFTALATDSNGATGSASVPVNVAAQAITFTVSPANPTAGQPAVVTIDGPPGCNTVNVYFGDGGQQTYTNGSGPPISNTHAWASPGQYTLTAVGLGGGCPNQGSAVITVLNPPSVSIVTPTAGTQYMSPVAIPLTAAASPGQGAIYYVAYYANGSYVGLSMTAPYAVTWSGVPAGTYSLTAVAVDTYGAYATSNSIAVVVGDPPPSTVLAVTVSPNPGPAWQYATITVTGTNPCGMLYMDFGDGNWWIAPIDSLPFTTYHLWGTGTYTVTAAGYASCGGVASTSATFTYGAPSPSPAPPGLRSPDKESSGAGFELDAGSIDADLSADEVRSEDRTRPSSDYRATEIDEPAETTNVNVIVDLNGTGSGSVSGSISCTGHATDCVGSFAAGATVTLTASPAAGSTWTGWGGACSGVSTTCTVTASDGLLIVANFRAAVTLTTLYYHLDVLGSVRAITDATGAPLEQHDYRAFGEDTQTLPAEGADSARFLGEQRDQTKLDLFEARYYSMFRGRFNSVDPGHADADPLVPQSWNAYTYARNNPFRFADPSGLGTDCTPGSASLPGDTGNRFCSGPGLGTSNPDPNPDPPPAFGGGIVSPYDPCRFAPPYSPAWIDCYANGGDPVAPGGASSGFQGPGPIGNPTPGCTGTCGGPGSNGNGPHSNDNVPPKGRPGDNKPTPKPAKPGCSDDTNAFAYALNASFILDEGAGAGPAFGVAWIPGESVWLAGGVGVSILHNASGGFLAGQNVPGVMHGLSFNAGYNMTVAKGGQLSTNTSGLIAGPAVGVPGASASVTYGVCFSIK